MIIWEQAEPGRRVRLPLSRGAIVGAAMALADAEGLSAVSLRRVAEALGVGPMRLYAFIGTKEQLLELMLDEVYAEVQPTGEGWRGVLVSLAGLTRAAVLRHPWCTELLGGRPALGPHALARGEAVMSALSALPVDDVMPVVAAVDAYVTGAVRREVGEHAAERSSGQDQAQWQAAVGPYLERRFASGDLPALSRVVRDAAYLDADQTFELGLTLLLDGIERRVEPPAPIGG